MSPSKPSKTESFKIIFAGLDNAGKTSIIKTLLREVSKIAIIKATKGAQRREYEFLGIKIGEWDLGGHQRYRDKYLEQPDLIFGGTEICIYVMDVQDKQRIPKSLNYLQQIINKFIMLEINPSVYVLFHKDDPDFTEDVKKEISRLIREVINNINKIPDYDNFSFYTTSIFEIKSIIKAMSEILLIKFPISDQIRNLIHDFARKINAEGIEILDNNTLMIGAYYKESRIKKILDSTSPYFLEVHDSFEKVQKEPWSVDDQMLVQKEGVFFHFRKFLLRRESPPYFIFICSPTKELDSEAYNKFIRELRAIIY